MEVPHAYDWTWTSISEIVRFRIIEIEDVQPSPRLQQAVKYIMTGRLPKTVEMKRETLPGTGVVGGSSYRGADRTQTGECRKGHDHVHDPGSDGSNQEVRAQPRNAVVGRQPDDHRRSILQYRRCHRPL